MRAKGECQKAIEYVESHSKESTAPGNPGPCITISRQSGAGSGLVDEKLKELLEARQSQNCGQWAIFDRNLIEKVLEDHNLPERLGKFLTAENFSSMNTLLNEMLGLQPSMRTLFHKTAETIMKLAYIGNVIIVGRGATVITAGLPNTFHVRLVAPFDNRVARIQEFHKFSKKEAIEFIKKEDEGRHHLFQKYFHKDIDDPLLYHMTLNTGMLSYEQSARIIFEAVLNKFPDKFNRQRFVDVLPEY